MVNDELRKKLMAAATPGEIRVILEEAGLDSGEDTVDEIWRKHKPTEAELEPLDDDELEIASGGDRDYSENGCDSTTDSSWYWASDACNMLIISYTNLWMMNLGTCPMCGGKKWNRNKIGEYRDPCRNGEITTQYEYQCDSCGYCKE